MTVFPLAAGQGHENDAAVQVLVCKPSLSKAMGALHPAAALYDKPVNLARAQAHHASLVKVLRQHGVKVHELHEVLEECATEGARRELEQLAATSLTYQYRPDDGADSADGSDADEESFAYWLSDEYKSVVLREMTARQLVDVVLTRPRVTVTPSFRDTGVSAAYTFEPLSNVLFCRDQQITTRKGVVMARLRSAQREKEVDILQFALSKMGVRVVGRVPAPGHLEGGDFFPLGEQIALVGVGPRTDMAAVRYLLREDLLGTLRVAVVRDELEASQERMHLDTVFNVVGLKQCVVVSDILGVDSPKRRMVDVYVRVFGEAEGEFGCYHLERSDIEFGRFLHDLNFSVIEITPEEQLNYGCNVLNVGNGKVIATDRTSARRLEKDRAFKGSVECIDFDGVTAMYGGVHCSTQVVLRRE